MGVAALFVFLAIVVAVLLGYPVALCLGGVALVVGYVLLGPAFMQFLPSRIAGVLSNYVLLAVPMFILMGLTLQRSGLADTLLRGVGGLAGRRPGGLGLAVLAVGALLAASTGIVGASVVTLGLIAMPILREAGYHDRVSSGIVVAAGSLGQIVPPSIVLVLLGSVMQVSVGRLFAAALLPSILIVGGYAVYLLALAYTRPTQLPALQRAASNASLQPQVDTAALGRAAAAPDPPLWLGIGGPLLLIVGVLGSILAGAASPTEASGVGAVLALGLLGASGRWSWRVVLDTAREALRLSSMVYLILLGATTFALVFRGLEGDDLLVGWVLGSGLSATDFVVLLLAVVFVAGFFIDFIEIIFIVVPVVLPVVAAYDIDPLWFAVLLGINLQTSFLTPPFGFSLFYFRGVAPLGLRTADLYRGALPYVLIQLLVLAVMFLVGV